ncbi:dockerin type I domain-containing protein [Planctomycetaceae bacterium SH139]
MQRKQVSKLQSRNRSSRRLGTEFLESRQLMAADLGISPDIRSAMLLRIQSSGVDVSAVVSQIRSSGMSTQQLMAMRQQIAGNPVAQAAIQQRLQETFVQTDPSTDSVANEVPATEPMALMPTPSTADASEPVTTEPSQQDDSPSETSLLETVRERVETRVGNRFDGEIPERLQERVAERRESGIDGRQGGPLNRLRAVADRVEVDPSEFVVRDEDGSIDREATRANVRERVENSEVANSIRDRVSERFDGEIPERLQERVAERRESGIDGRPGGPLNRLRAIADRVEVDPSEFVVRDEDGSIDREATRANVRERVENSELANNIRDRVSERFDGEIPVWLQESLSPNTAQPTLGAPLVSSLGRQDVNRDGAFSAVDALLVINAINDPDKGYDELVDVNLDGQVTAIDALQVINSMNRRSAPPPAIVAPMGAAAIDDVFARGLDDVDDEEDELFFLV